MKRGKMPDSQVTHPNVTPLIDVVMCLIIFYMLVAKIGIRTGAEEKIDLPTSIQGIKIKDIGNTVTLNVTAAGEQPMVTTLIGGNIQEVKVVEAGKKPLKSLLELGKKYNPNLKVIIRGDQNLDYRFLEPVLFTCAEAQVKEVNFATKETK
jgi:biopolymer transport protein ExbD